MSSLAVLVPVKASGTKSRLSSLLSRRERKELESLLLSGVLEALRGADLLGMTHVVSSDPEVLRFATGSGAGAVREAKDEGVNAAVLAGTRAVGRPDRVLVLPSDLPLLRAAEVKHVLYLSRFVDAVLAPSASLNGTNALVFPTDVGFPLSYDDDSFWNHLRACGRKLLSVGIPSARGLTFDLDSPDDLRALARSGRVTPAVAFARSATG